MSDFSGYKTKAFSESQKFFVLDPRTGSPSFVQGSDLVAQLTPNSNYVYSESTRTTAAATDYEIGSLVETAGATSAGDNFAATYLVVASGAGDFPMDNGNELLVIKGDEFLREQLAQDVSTGNGATLVNGATIYVGSVAEGISGLTPTEGQKYSVIGWYGGAYAFADPSTRGGVELAGSSATAKADHNGITIFSPTVPPVSAQAGATLADRRDNYINGAGETDPTGTGCFVSLEKVISPMQAGALKDGTDDTLPIQKAIDVSGVNELPFDMPLGDFTCAGDLLISGYKRDMRFRGRLIYTGTGTAVTLDNVVEKSVIRGIFVHREIVTSGAASASMLYEGIRIKRVKASFFYDIIAQGFRVGLSFGGSAGLDAAYNEFYNTQTRDCLIAVDIAGLRDSHFVNENKFFGGRFVIGNGWSDHTGSRYVQIESVDGAGDLFGGWASNNKFFGVTMESSVVERKLKLKTTNTKFVHCYFEATNSFTYDMEVEGSGNEIQGHQLTDQKILDADYGTRNTYLDSVYKAVAGNVAEATVTVTANYNASGVRNIFVDTTSGPVQITLPDATDQTRGLGHAYNIHKISTDNNLMTVVSSGPSGKTWRYEAPNSRAKFVSNGTTFRVVEGSTGSLFRALTVGSVPDGGQALIAVTSAFFVDAGPSPDPTYGHRVEMATSDLNGLTATAYPRRANELRVLFYNEAGAAIDLGTVNCWFYFS